MPLNTSLLSFSSCVCPPGNVGEPERRSPSSAMMSLRKHLYPPNWRELSMACKAAAGWRCQHCGIRHGARRKSKRTGKWYQVWLHAAHKYLADTFNPHPHLLCLCPTCHGRRDYWQRLGLWDVRIERRKHRRLLASRGYAPCSA